ncbi:tyrosine/serine/threonine protein phosphatase pps1 [Agyrium rufum]|nr:tyrosine/serine/threonine protein phosphatase pps1 [Agyrium rufum]
MATLVVQQHSPLRQSATPPPRSSSSLSLDMSQIKSRPIPNKHIPYCSPGPIPSSNSLPQTPVTPPSSPPDKKENQTFSQHQALSLLYPPDKYSQIGKDLPRYSLDAAQLVAALHHASSQSLPESKLVFPWLHGLHSDNQMQLAFFNARRKSQRRPPLCLRGITIVKARGDLSKSKLKGAVSAKELLTVNPGNKVPTFLDLDPKEGFSVRNFQVQTAKMATLSDIVIYGADDATEAELNTLAQRFVCAQRLQRERMESSGRENVPLYNTFVVKSPFSDFERDYPELVAIDSKGDITGKVVDLFQLERQEMMALSRASEISNNVWLGPTPPESSVPNGSDKPTEMPAFDIHVEASDLAHPHELSTLNKYAELSLSSPQHIEFPSSGSIVAPTWSHSEVDGLLTMCHWIYALANPEMTPDPSDDGSDDDHDADGDVKMKITSPLPRKILIHCADGYTETSLLALAYMMFAECLTVSQAWLRLHCDKKRNFFAYPSDVNLLTAIQPRLLHESPKSGGGFPTNIPEDPTWQKSLDGSLPSRILEYMYLGNLCHANNPELLREMGIGQVLSVGEPVNWDEDAKREWGEDRLLFVGNVQDNGVDPLLNEFERCLDFIRKSSSASDPRECSGPIGRNSAWKNWG